MLKTLLQETYKEVQEAKELVKELNNNNRITLQELCTLLTPILYAETILENKMEDNND